MSRVQVFFTVDVEIWPGAWTDIDGRFPEAFQRYIYGPTPFGPQGLPLKLQVLRDHGLKGVFFVEPVFSARFGLAPLQEVVGLIQEGGQEVQLHVHAEWLDEARVPIVARPPAGKVQHLSLLSLEHQTELIGWSQRRLHEAGAVRSNAFRAGSFMFNRDTLRALEANGLAIDSSYNHYFHGPASGIVDASLIPILPFRVGNVLEVPVTVYRDLPFNLRPVQLKGCSLAEMKSVLHKAADAGHSTVVIVSHSFELLDRRDYSRDETVVQRFTGLCEFLAQNRDRFETRGFADTQCEPVTRQPIPVTGNTLGLGVRYMEQVKRRL